ncbi:MULTISPECIES: hypothetical protein [unclassified Crossiella]|uniref:hypothetical protein n=1 Tax=unclassified Crossiella TaxID=2620835 RepID=UPI001FFE4B6D|nr:MULTISPECIES: hypothetical protein [unclassified Crossiella]MCK2239743.1 hypothetical protein [Crossiella sp. S99.2]MCK2252438.1 hypothetical protein [Crossiella sp. S99.1]
MSELAGYYGRWEDATPPPSGGSLKIKVERDQVLRALAIFQREGEDLQQELMKIEHKLRLPPCGGDPVSEDTAKAMTWKFVDAPDSYYKRYLGLAESFLETASQLRASARDYGFTDDDVANALKGYKRVD